jgi:hypothetical protein
MSSSGAKTAEEARPLFLENPMERAAELRFAPPGVFNYYIFCFVDLLLSPKGAGESDMASCFLRLVRDRTASRPSTLNEVWDRLGPAVSEVATRQAVYEADVDIYGSFLHLQREIESSREKSNQRDA